MSIRLKLLIAAFVYLAITIGVGFYARDQEQELSGLAIEMYDSVVKGIDYAHKTQSEFVRFVSHYKERPAIDDDEKAELAKILDNMDVAVQGAMTDKIRDQAKAIRAQIAVLHDLPLGAPITTDLTEIDKGLSKLVEKYINHGLNFRISAEETVDKNVRNLKIANGAAVVISLVITALLWIAVLPPLRRAVAVAQAISEGKLDNEIIAKGNSEPAQLLNALSLMQTSISDNIKRIEEQTKLTEKQAALDKKRKTELETIAQRFEMQVGDLLETVTQSANTMKGSAESMVEDVTKTDGNLQNTILATAEASSNVAAVAAASEELTASINEIAQQISRSSAMTQGAVQKAQAADTTIKQLSQSAQKINEIVELIGSIAGQINLLALNATIESARAGEAGKGFAVVASEVKSLANQTSKATEAISSQITDIRNVINAVVSSLTDIQSTINEMGGISTTIASAMEEQGAATKEIAHNIQITSMKVQEVSANIGEVGAMSKATNENSRNVLESVNSFSSQSQLLNGEIEQFLKNIAAS